MKPITCLCALAILSGFAVAQQPNSSDASFVVNGNAGPVFPITGVSLPRGVAANVSITGPASAPFLLFGAPALYPSGWPVLGGQLLDVDIGNGGFILLDGIQNPTAFNTGATGFTTAQTIPAGTAIGTSAAFQCLVASATNPNGAVLSGATQINVTAGLTVIPLAGVPNNGGVPFDFTTYGLAFSYYTNTYTRMFVNADGNVTFNTAGTDFTPTPTQFISQQPRIAPMWTDLEPQYAGAQIVVTVDDLAVANPFPTIVVDWIMMAEWNNAGSRHSFQLRLNMLTGDIVMIHDPFNGATVYTILMGISPGQSLLPAGGMFPVQRNLSAMSGTPVQGAVNEALYEWFGLTTMANYTVAANNPWDMAGTTTTFTALSPGTATASYIGN